MIEAQMEQARLEEVAVPGRAGWRAGLCPVTGRLTRSGEKLSQGAFEKVRMMTGAEETSSGPGWKRLKDLRFASFKECK